MTFYGQEKVDAAMPTLSPSIWASFKDVDLTTQTVYMGMLDRGTSNAESIANDVDIKPSVEQRSGMFVYPIRFPRLF